MSEKYQFYRWVYEMTWFLAAFIITFVATFKIFGSVRPDFFWFLSSISFGAFTYIRWIIFPEHSPLMFSFWVKVVMFFVNIPLFMLVLRYFTAALEVFDSFNFSYENRAGQLIAYGTPVELIAYIRDLTIFSGSVMLISIVLYQLRTIHLIFKWRQVPKSFSS
jgi:hypothetical protein